MTVLAPICMECQHYNRTNFEGLTCAAFPEGIPDEIIIEGNNHSEPLADQDNEIVFEQVED